MKENLAALNVICEGRVINKRGIPLLFYWNGQTEILEDIKKSEDFFTWLKEEEIITDINYFLHSHIGLFYYRENDEDYQEITVDVQDLYSLDQLLSLKNNLMLECTYYLYNKAFPNRDLGIQIFEDPIEQSSAYIKAILKKYQGKITEQTCIMAIRGYMQERYKDFKSIEELVEYIDKVIFN